MRNKCPRCGSELDEDVNGCLNCGWAEKNKRNLCPECGEYMVRGVCYKCGYRKKKSRNTCPYCRQKLVKGFCERCNYKQGEGPFFLIILIIIALLIFMGW